MDGTLSSSEVLLLLLLLLFGLRLSERWSGCILAVPCIRAEERVGAGSVRGMGL